ncbi:unnamed protein product [Mycena citricolor]|uniref:Nicotinamide-nucleotide adenylyltransferase n=1 Tax=Mycena citricolor TaxID=2018698 RepID=A0AAD2H404_9AGAR|nr:unnamed protein product [Mycena citricolor]
MDSSFNPPTRAHMALANAPRPFVESSGYDAKIYLLSIKNADKTLKSTDATYLQRLEMMRLLAQDAGDEDSVAVGIIDEPTFVGKATKLQTFLKHRLSALSANNLIRPELTFILGFDTLERLVAPRYYSSSSDGTEAEAKMFAALDEFFSPDVGNARVACARRSPTSDAEESTLRLAEKYFKSNRIAFIDIGVAEQTYSSTAVRTALGRGDNDSWEDLVSPRVRDYLLQQILYSN